MPQSHRLQDPFTPLEDRLSSQLQGPRMNTSHFDSQAHPMSLHILHPQTDPRYVVPPDYTIPNVSPGHPQDYYQSQGPKPIFQPLGPSFRTEPAQEPLPFERPPPDQFASNRYEDAVYFDERENDSLNDDRGTRSAIGDFQYTNDWAQNRLRNPPERSGQSSRNYPRKSRDFEHDDPRDRAMGSEKGPLWSYQDISRTRSDTAEGWRQRASFCAPQTREERHSEQKQMLGSEKGGGGQETAIDLGRERRFQGEMERITQEQCRGARGSRLSKWASSVTRPMAPRRRGSGSSRSTSPDEAIDNYQRGPVA
ncbi:hypothetical protein CPAR01_10708 [Colletotrichum paranaense]|uniref:Uncharacterized protein n=1 Tax=Colletotrichum paranaense TaxID=1914294 RepID=A0ABQ9SEQ4_9PEZI|nr:uncharacterized protein CPAR01_10708 [Colletotrichum paranaense]KAK1534000.1 hypothetical protein CPAR01_10708 [Colletotrichum paranaense]